MAILGGLGTALEFGAKATRGVSKVFVFGVFDARALAFSFGDAFLVAPGGSPPPLFEIVPDSMLSKQ